MTPDPCDPTLSPADIVNWIRQIKFMFRPLYVDHPRFERGVKPFDAVYFDETTKVWRLSQASDAGASEPSARAKFSGFALRHLNCVQISGFISGPFNFVDCGTIYASASTPGRVTSQKTDTPIGFNVRHDGIIFNGSLNIAGESVWNNIFELVEEYVTNQIKDAIDDLTIYTEEQINQFIEAWITNYVDSPEFLAKLEELLNSIIAKYGVNGSSEDIATIQRLVEYVKTLIRWMNMGGSDGPGTAPEPNNVECMDSFHIAIEGDARGRYKRGRTIYITYCDDGTVERAVVVNSWLFPNGDRTMVELASVVLDCTRGICGVDLGIDPDLIGTLDHEKLLGRYFVDDGEATDDPNVSRHLKQSDWDKFHDHVATIASTEIVGHTRLSTDDDYNDINPPEIAVELGMFKRMLEAFRIWVQQQIQNILNLIQELREDLDQEIQDRINSDNQLQVQINNLSGTIKSHGLAYDIDQGNRGIVAPANSSVCYYWSMVTAGGGDDPEVYSTAIGRITEKSTGSGLTYWKVPGQFNSRTTIMFSI